MKGSWWWYRSRLVPGLLLRFYQCVQLTCLLQMKQEKHNFGILLPFDFSTKKSQRLLLREAFGVFIIRDQLNIISKDSLIQWNSESTLKRSCDLLRLGLSNLNHVFHIARCPSMTGSNVSNLQLLLCLCSWVFFLSPKLSSCECFQKKQKLYTFQQRSYFKTASDHLSHVIIHQPG